MLVLAIIYLIAGVSVAVAVHVYLRRPKIEFQIPKEYEQLVKDVAEWLEDC